ncbi:MAG: carboxymuconolactone decarboxylase family protein [Isosphaeraceae bacterium]|nr:carboxymuconolactone decarboxylase family protein [Isosphaeraceae bacterium]
MGLVSYIEKDQAAESVRPIYDNVAQKLGSMLNMFKALAHNPDLLQGFMALNGAMSKSKLSPKLRELAYLRASQINGCDYCQHYHTRSGQKAGLSESQIQAMGRPEPGSEFDELEWDILRFADQVTRRARADDELIARLKQRLSDRELVELTATVALANFTNRFNDTLRIDLP